MEKDKTSVEAQLRQGEEQLLEPVTRRSPEAISRLLAEDFCEFGSSGRIFNKRQIIEALQSESETQFSIADFRVKILAPDVALVTYKATRPYVSGQQATVSLRSSIWVMRDGGWQILFHHGTNAAA